MQSFITNSTSHFVRGLSSFVDMEFSTDEDEIKASGKSFIAWHPTANRSKKIWDYFRENDLPSYFMERGALPDTVVIDPGGFLLNSPSYREANWNVELNDVENRLIDNYLRELRFGESSLEFQESARRSAKYIRGQLNLGTKKVVFVPLQLANDQVTVRWGGWTGGVVGFQKTLNHIAQKLSNYVFLVKNHPLSKNPNANTPRVRSFKNIVVVDSFHYKDCLEVADMVLTINSGVGLQAMAWRKPAVVLGGAFYQFADLNFKATSIDHLMTLLSSDLSIDQGKATRFLYFLKFKLYSDCVLTKSPRDKYKNETSRSKYLNVRIFNG